MKGFLMGNDKTRLNNFLVLLFSELILFLVIQIITFVLRHKFERALKVGKFDIAGRTNEIFEANRTK